MDNSLSVVGKLAQVLLYMRGGKNTHQNRLNTREESYWIIWLHSRINMALTRVGSRNTKNAIRTPGLSILFIAMIRLL